MLCMLKPNKVVVVGFFCLLDWGLLLLLVLLLLFVCFLNMPLSLSAIRVSSFSVDYELHFYSLSQHWPVLMPNRS